MGVRSLRRSLLLSVVVHALLIFACFLLLRNQPAKSPTRPLTWIELDPAKKPEADRKKAEESEKLRRQIVQTERGQETKKAVPDASLGERTQTVDRETVGRQHTTVMGKSAPPPAGGKPHHSEKVELGNLGIAMLPSQRPNAVQPEGPRETDRHWSTGGQAAQDFVPGVAEGERTALNTKEYVFYGYFQRIRERLDRAWVPILRGRLARFYRAGRHLASEMDYRTRVTVYLNNRGEIVRVQMVNESGAKDLDDSAISAFNEAGPFPNPPQGIVDRNGEIQIPWEFVLKT